MENGRTSRYPRSRRNQNNDEFDFDLVFNFNVSALADLAEVWTINEIFGTETHRVVEPKPKKTNRRFGKSQQQGKSSDVGDLKTEGKTTTGYADGVQYIFVKEASECNKYLQTFREFFQDKVVGLDTEWINCHGIEKVAILQLCSVNNYCILIHMPYLEYVPTELRDFLQDETILKVGVGIDLDVKRLNHIENRGIEVKGAVDLRYLANKNTSLAELSVEYLYEIMNKGRGKAWDWFNPTERQINYAVKDAECSAKIFEEVFRRKGLDVHSNWHAIYSECKIYMDKVFRASRKPLNSSNNYCQQNHTESSSANASYRQEDDWEWID